MEVLQNPLSKEERGIIYQATGALYVNVVEAVSEFNEATPNKISDDDMSRILADFMHVMIEKKNLKSLVRAGRML